MIIDSHQHFWQVGRFPYPWLTRDLGVLYRDYLPSDLAPILKNNGVDETVVVQASNSIAESRWLLDLAHDNPVIAGVVGWVDLTDTQIEDQLDELTADPKFKGIRHLVESEPADDWLIQPAVLKGLQRISARNLTFDLLVHTRHLKYLPYVIDSCPDLHFVIDHLAKPPIAAGEIKAWSLALKPLANYATLYCKVSGLVTEADHSSWHPDNFRPYVDYALEFFGPSRLIFGSDYPVCLLAASYERVLELSRTLLSDVSTDELEKIFSENAKNFYKLNTDV